MYNIATPCSVLKASVLSILHLGYLQCGKTEMQDIWGGGEGGDQHQC